MLIRAQFRKFTKCKARHFRIFPPAHLGILRQKSVAKGFSTISIMGPLELREFACKSADRIGFGIRSSQVETAVKLLCDSCTVAFITRYRREETGGLDEEQISNILRLYNECSLLSSRKSSILQSLRKSGANVSFSLSRTYI